jgi:hypothetical protein
MERPGLVELRSGTGHFWLRAYLFVDHHPYYTHTDESGRFTFSDVPPGTYEVVAWHPEWRVARIERQPDSQHIMQVYYRQPLESKQTVTVSPEEEEEGRQSAATIRLLLKP